MSVDNRKSQIKKIETLEAKIKELQGFSTVRNTMEPHGIMRDTPSVVNNTMKNEDSKNHQTGAFLEINPNQMKTVSSRRSEIMIDMIPNSNSKLEHENSELEHNLVECKLENEKLKMALERAVKRSTIYQSKFFEMKDRIYRQTKKLTEEINKIRRNFEEKTKIFFLKYTRILKEIVLKNSDVNY